MYYIVDYSFDYLFTGSQLSKGLWYKVVSLVILMVVIVTPLPLTDKWHTFTA